MRHEVLLGIFAIVFFFQFIAFGMQRSVLLLSREMNYPYSVVGVLLPPWFIAVWAIVFLKWAILVYVALTWSWAVAIALLIGSFVLSAILPLPFAMYKPMLRSRAMQIKRLDEDVGQSLAEMVDRSEVLASWRGG